MYVNIVSMSEMHFLHIKQPLPVKITKKHIKNAGLRAKPEDLQHKVNRQ